MATDPELIADATGRVRDRGLTPERAVWEAIGVTAESIRTAGARQALRVSDLYDVRDRIISSLIGRVAPGVADPGHPYVLLAVDLAPRTLPAWTLRDVWGSPLRRAGQRLTPQSSLDHWAFQPSPARTV